MSQSHTFFCVCPLLQGGGFLLGVRGAESLRPRPQKRKRGAAAGRVCAGHSRLQDQGQTPFPLWQCPRLCQTQVITLEINRPLASFRDIPVTSVNLSEFWKYCFTQNKGDAAMTGGISATFGLIFINWMMRVGEEVKAKLLRFWIGYTDCWGISAHTDV